MIRAFARFAPLAAFGLFALASAEAGAQATLHFREGQRIDPQEVRQILDQPDRQRGTTRSIRLLHDAPAADTPADAPTALSLPVQFDFDSAAILPSAREQLDALAQGIKLLPPQRQVVIEGHTDAVGADDYNAQLSLRRATAVKLYLVRAHGIEARRLRDIGRGEREPIAGSDPHAPENRRVQFRGS